MTDTLEKELAFYKQYTGYLENGEPADEPALECKKCGAYYFHDLGGKSLCGDCLEALAEHCERLQARIDAVLSLKARSVDIMPNMTAGELYDAERYVTLRDVKAKLLGEETK